MNSSEASSQAALGEKGCCWSVTINNPTAEDFQQWDALKGLHWVREVMGQIEKGENGTPHIQGCVKTLSVRFAQVKKALPRAHIEKAKSPAALVKYVAKQETRLAALPTTKIATQVDVQKALLEEVLLYGHTRYEWPGTYFLEFLETHTIIDRDWEYWVDRAVNRLIREGYYGVEFVMANPQIRQAFKKYFRAILYRTYNARSQEAVSQAQGTSQEARIQEADGPDEVNPG